MTDRAKTEAAETIEPAPEEKRTAREAGDADYLARVRSADRASETARLTADRANAAAADVSATHRLETYEEAFARLGLVEAPSVSRIVELAVVRELVPMER